MCSPTNDTTTNATNAAAAAAAAATNTKSSFSEVAISVSFEDLSYTVPIVGNNNKKDDQPSSSFTILKGLNGCFVPGKLTALMGPSGSGKSTLLDTLAGRKNSGNIDGQVLYNGTEPTLSDHRFTVGYVEQFDTLVGELTVEHMLKYTAELKLPSDLTAAQRDARVEEVIQMLDLESCRSTVIGSSLMRGISGGQAKRVNIGLALITRPPVLFLDEPTSGLDSRTANEVVELLRVLAHEHNRTIVCTIHSPTGHAFSLFDTLYMIHKGETIYDGPVPSAQAYFENHAGHVRDADASLPEWLVDITSDMESIQNRRNKNASTTALEEDEDGIKTTTKTEQEEEKSSFVNLFQSSEMKLVADQSRKDLMKSLQNHSSTSSTSRKDSSSSRMQHHQAPSEWSKLITLLKYRGVAHYQDGEFLGTRFGDKLVFALLILSLYYGIGEETDPQSVASTTTLLFFIAALCGFGAAAFVPALNLERKLFYRELADGCYHPATYYFSKFIEEAFIALFTSGVFGVIVFFGLKLTGNFGIFFVSYYLTTLIGVILAYAVAAAVPSLEAANAILPTYVTICLYFGGLFIVFDKIPTGWVWFSWTSFMRYSWGAMMLNNYNPDAPTSHVNVFFDADGNPQTVLQFYGMDDGPIMDSIGACLGCLTLLLGVFTVLGVLALVYIRHEKR
eukprot:CAMPEP_0117025940 /NCGR_PEP_ID=MMETSP0472-20121206/19112_1 /TAXON_ID=693140 ORGANISM="Tiarina fusus, Strain LIS" /NCGR_SAMPLE_ID=MMETSP0472 /ASSEMBLY_ACC=CAM_ASM_000603 /LENGTH=674 /DNA_ID=CAMNT_0004732795 /DNA_START=65 /DNA_END=2089 /DNA_ORIENTATION=-